MNNESVEKLLNGVGVIIDDDVEKIESSSFTLKTSIEEHGVPLVTYKSIPNEKVVDSFGNISFVILDWKFDKCEESFLKTEEFVSIGEELQKEQEQTILEFLKALVKKCFVPVFIITEQNFEDVKQTLYDEELYDEQAPNNIIMVKRKSEIHSFEELLSHVGNWLQETPSAYALKLWDCEASKTKNEMFLDLYQASPNWVSVILDSMKFDTKNNEKATNHEFGSFLNMIFINRMVSQDYCKINYNENYSSDSNVIRKILQSERYIEYNLDTIPTISYTGDLYKNNNEDKYYLNIRPQCDLVRDNNPVLYLLEGTELEPSKISKRTIEFSMEQEQFFLNINHKRVLLDELMKTNINKDDAIQTVNMRIGNKIKSINSIPLFENGEIIDKKVESIIACIADKFLIRFEFKSFRTKNKSELDKEATIIGRIMSPYVTRIQKNFAAYSMREGVMSLPEKLFDL